MSELADLVGRDVSQISRWLRRDDWPFGGPPWNRGTVPKVLRWVADVLERQAPAGDSDGDGADDTTALRKDKLRQEIRKLRANADQAETALARERGKLMDAGAVEGEWTSIGVVVRNAFQNLGSQLVPLALSHGMPNEAAAVYGQQVDETVGGILRHLSRDGTEDDK